MALYQLENSFKYSSTVLQNLTFNSTERMKDYDGYFAKKDDNLTVTVEFLEENMDTSN